MSLPRYVCHKTVGAFKIQYVEHPAKDALVQDIHLTGEGHDVIVSPEWIKLHRPPAGQFFNGGYFVQYDDGYTSWSPAAAFEAGYTHE